MALSLRNRIVLTLLPFAVLMAVLGGAAGLLLYQVGGSIDAILRENYRSVIYMERLKEALERIDSSFTFALAGQEAKARKQYAEQWRPYLDNLEDEQENITIAGEGELVHRLTELTERYRRQGDEFYNRPPGDPARNKEYFSANGLLDSFKEIKDTADQILHINQNAMQQASGQARQMAQRSLIGFGLVLAGAGVVGAWLARRTVRSILQPIQAVTRSARGIASGNLDQVVPVVSGDELGQLAEEFNTMARQLRTYRQSDYSRLLRAQRTSQATIDSFPDPVLVVDPEGRVEMANPEAQRLFGISSRPDDGLTHPPWQPPEGLHQPLQAALRSHQPYVPREFDRAILLRIGGQEQSFLPRILPICDPYGQTLGAAVLLQDVTRFRLLDQVKTDLVATSSHELKTPLTSVRLALHLLLEETIGPLTPKQTELLLDARDNAERLLAMVNNLLDLAKLEQGQAYLELQPESPARLLQSTADEVRPRAEDKGITLVVEAPPDLPRVAADVGRLGRALGNLLDNAMAYTERGGKITLSAASTEDKVTLRVADTGSGIPAEFLPHVFERFFRIPGQSHMAGTGLGLAIVREIVSAHGGTITCTSQPGEGTVFCVSLPAWPEDVLGRTSA